MVVGVVVAVRSAGVFDNLIWFINGFVVTSIDDVVIGVCVVVIGVSLDLIIAILPTRLLCTVEW